MSLAERIRAFYNPEMFQGWGKTKKYFEGWYFKIVSRDLKHAYALIPGIAYDEAGSGHAFVQVLDGRNATAQYHKFDVGEFDPSDKGFSVRVGSNLFSEKGLELDLPSMKGTMTFKGNVPWPKPWYSPGIMGPFAYAPFMECYHGIVSMDHELEGTLQVGGDTIDFGGGRGYLEKDWGRSFPEAYVWMQSNHFAQAGISIKSSVARIPWVTGAFTGFIAGVWIGDRLLRFTTYNGTKLKVARVGERYVEIVMANRNYQLEIHAERPEARTMLASPIMGAMEGRIAESMTAQIDVTITDLSNKTIVLNDTGVSGGLEVAGRIELIADVV